MSEYDEDRIAEVSRRLFELATEICLLPNGQLDCLTLALAMADVTGSNAGLLPSGEELVFRAHARLRQTFNVSRNIGSMQ